MGLKELLGLGNLPKATRYKENKSANDYLADYEASEAKRKAKAAKKKAGKPLASK